MPKSTPERCKAELERIICESMNRAIGLHKILTAERKALEQQDTDALHKAATDKEECISKLERLETERAKLSVSRGFASGPEDMKPLLAWCDEDSVVKNAWKQFLEVAMACNELNATNGSIIRLRRSQILNALALLRGGESEPELYSPQGRENGGDTGRALAEA